jgi:hypothetical protein
MAKNTFNGTPGDDTYLVDHTEDAILESPNGGTDTVVTLVSYSLPPDVENLTLSPLVGDINGSGNELDNVMISNGGYNYLWAQQGNDTLVASDGGTDFLAGGDGDDTVVLAHNLGDYTIRDAGYVIEILGPANTTYLTGIEHLQFADGMIDVVDDGNPMFDALNYLSRNPDVFHAGVDPLFHFNTVGWKEGRDPNSYFDTSAYLAVNKDVAAAGMNPLDHYHLCGWKEGRDPTAWFDTTLYLINNPDVAAAGMDPFQHYMQFGIQEYRIPLQANRADHRERLRCRILSVAEPRRRGSRHRSAVPLQYRGLEGGPRSERLVQHVQLSEPLHRREDSRHQPARPLYGRRLEGRT